MRELENALQHCLICDNISQERRQTGENEMRNQYAEVLPRSVESKFNSSISEKETGGILTISSNPELSQLEKFVDYEGEKFSAIRKVVDQLDQVTFWRTTEKHDPRNTPGGCFYERQDRCDECGRLVMECICD